MASRRPNILFIQADQMTAAVLPFYGGQVVKAPHLSHLAAEGALFEHFYCNSPLCAPSRFSMLSGQLPSKIGAYDNAAEFPAHLPTFAHALRAMDYRTALCGKMHFVGPDQLHGFEERLTTDIYPADFGWTPNWRQPEAHQDYFHTMLSVVEAGPCDRSMQIDFDDEVAFHGQRWIYDAARSGDERPFFLVVSFTHPHDPYSISRPYWARYDPAEIDLPAVPAIAAEDQDPHSRRLYRNYRIADYDLTEARIRAARHAYYGAISYIDDKVGELLAALEASGLDEDTIVIFTSDHGDMLGERGLWYKMHFFEWAARIPLLIHGPRWFAPRRVSSDASLLDLFPSLMAMAGLEGGAAPAPALPDDPAGRSLLPDLQGEDPPEEAEVLGEYLGEGAAGPLVMIKRGRHKFILGEDCPALLYDLNQDPLEQVNLAEQEAHRPLARAFAEEVAQRWDFAALKEQVIADQDRRAFVDRALKKGRYTAWDHQPVTDASRLYARNVGDTLGDAEHESRLPSLARPEPD